MSLNFTKNNGFLTIIILLVIISGCQNRKKNNHSEILPISDKYRVQYSSKFEIEEVEGGVLLKIKSPFNNSGDYHYLLTRTEGRSLKSEYIPIKIPVNKVIPVSTSYISMIEYLGEEHTIKGFPQTDYISSEKVRKLIASKEIIDIGVETDFNIEMIAEIDPDLMIGYAVNSANSYDAIKKFGIEVLFSADYLEQHPLGRAEWIKVFGLLYDKYDLADSIFNSIVAKYDSAKNTVNSNHDSFSVISGSLYGDAWYLPGGQNYASSLLKDAGYNYIYSKDSSESFLKLSFESVYEDANAAKYWISPAPFSNLEMLAESDDRYRNFKAFELKNVWCYDNSMGEKGGNNYLELGYLRPDIILKDLLYIRDSTLFPTYKPFFYRKLE